MDLPTNGGFVKGLTISGNTVSRVYAVGIATMGEWSGASQNFQPVHNKFVYVAGNTV